MRFTDIVFSRKKNLGNYESEEVSISAVVAEDENVSDCLALVKQEVLHALGMAVDPVVAAPTKKATPIDTKVTKPAIVTEEAPVDTSKEDAAKAKKEAAAAKKAEKDAAAKAKKEAAAAKKAEKATVPYNREEKSHRIEFAKVLASVNPNWKTECAELGKAASADLSGKPMMDDEGKILPEFKALVEEAIKEEEL